MSVVQLIFSISPFLSQNLKRRLFLHTSAFLNSFCASPVRWIIYIWNSKVHSFWNLSLALMKIISFKVIHVWGCERLRNWGTVVLYWPLYTSSSTNHFPKRVTSWLARIHSQSVVEEEKKMFQRRHLMIYENKIKLLPIRWIDLNLIVMDELNCAVKIKHFLSHNILSYNSHLWLVLEISNTFLTPLLTSTYILKLSI